MGQGEDEWMPSLGNRAAAAEWGVSPGGA
jgi:hypothetical protein